MLACRLAASAALLCLVLTAPAASAAPAAPALQLNNSAPYSKIAGNFQSCAQGCRRPFDQCMDRVDPRYCEARLESCMKKCESQYIGR